jgi:Tfp pilus assembly protein PilF
VTTDPCSGGARRWLLVALLALGLSSGFSATAGDLEEAEQDYFTGQYGAAIRLAEKATRERSDLEEWHLLLSRSLLAVGQYSQALAAITNALEHQAGSLPLHWQAREVFLANGQPNAAREAVLDIVRRVSARPRAYQDAGELVAFGQAALLNGADPKKVLDQLFEPARKAQPKLRDVYLAAGGLALEKHDFALAARKFQEGLKQLPDDPDLHFGLAEAYAPSDGALMGSSLQAALARNSNHLGSLLLLAERSIDAEDYNQVEQILDRVDAINPWHPQAWAYRAALAHLRHQPDTEQSARERALRFWPANPWVDYWIGLKLSQNYRFSEGAAYQRQALAHDPEFTPAKAQLAQDLLRLGEESEGWNLAQQVQQQDAYDAAAFNLLALRDTMRRFATLTNEEFLVRMGTNEAAIYGPRVLDLLGQARKSVCAKYGLEVRRPTTVEIFPEQKDFAVRTFGMPGNPGYLGVCFGTVITANSPASHPDHPINWEAVLWHEFCHVVTLQLTHNKMPRWLSEGISVYEELQANPAWGQHLSPRYREMLLDEDLTPVSELSAAFLAPESDLNLQFAYYESSLVVEFLVQRFGLESLKAILHDLGEGGEINSTLERRTEPMTKLEEDFVSFAHERANQLGPGLDWTRPDPDLADSESDAPSVGLHLEPIPVGTNASPKVEVARAEPTAVATNGSVRSASVKVAAGSTAKDQSWHGWAEAHPTNFWVMTRQAQALIEDKQWTQVKPILEQLLALYPDFIGPDSAYRLLAGAHRALGETNAERRVLTALAQRDDEAREVYARLMELGAEAKDWTEVRTNALSYLALNPLVQLPYQYLKQAAQQLGDVTNAISACRSLLAIGPTDAAQVHFELAQLLHQSDQPEAKRQLLEALELAPRYRPALRLLLEMNAAEQSSSATRGSPVEPQTSP